MNCPNCNAEIKNGFIKSNQLLSQDAVDLINSNLSLNAETYCNKCGDNLYKEVEVAITNRENEIEGSRSKLRYRIDLLKTWLNGKIKDIPVVTDFFGAKSNSFTSKLIKSENII